MKKSTEILVCPTCKKDCKGKQGLKTHMMWAHDPASREKRLTAARKNVKRAQKVRNTAPAPQKPKRRKWTRRTDPILVGKALKKPRKMKARKKWTRKAIPALRVPFNYCPKCGFHLEPLSIAAGFDPSQLNENA